MPEKPPTDSARSRYVRLVGHEGFERLFSLALYLDCRPIGDRQRTRKSGIHWEPFPNRFSRQIHHIIEFSRFPLRLRQYSPQKPSCL